MSDTGTPTKARRARGGRAARAAKDATDIAPIVPYVTRKIPYYEVLDDDGLKVIEENAETILAEVGIEFRDDEEALQIWRDAGADVQGELVKFPRGMCRKLIQDSAPREFTQHARNPQRSVVVGGKNTIFVPAYGSPFVSDMDLSLIHI